MKIANLQFDFTAKKLDNSDLPIGRKVEKTSLLDQMGLGEIEEFLIRLQNFFCLSMFYLTAKFQKILRNRFADIVLRTHVCTDIQM